MNQSIETEFSVFNCTQCGGELHPDEGQLFLSCPYCNSTVYLDKSRVVFHWYLAPTLNNEQAGASLSNWMAGNATVKDLDKKSKILSQTFQYFPIWFFKVKNGENEKIYIEPAAATSITELRSLNLPAGDLRKYDDAISAQSAEPSVPLQAALNWLGSKQIDSSAIKESALVHIPIYTFKYGFKNQMYTALVEAATGKTIANIFPAKAEAPYMAAGCAAASVFLCLAGILAISLTMNDGASSIVGALICLGGGVIAAPLLFAIASWVASKV